MSRLVFVSRHFFIHEHLPLWLELLRGPTYESTSEAYGRVLCTIPQVDFRERPFHALG